MLSPKDEIHKDLTRIIENNTKEAEEIKVSFFALNGSENWRETETKKPLLQQNERAGEDPAGHQKQAQLIKNIFSLCEFAATSLKNLKFLFFSSTIFVIFSF